MHLECLQVRIFDLVFGEVGVLLFAVSCLDWIARPEDFRRSCLHNVEFVAMAVSEC